MTTKFLQKITALSKTPALRFCAGRCGRLPAALARQKATFWPGGVRNGI